MKKKKNRHFKDLDINIESYQPLKTHKIIKNNDFIYIKRIITLPDISYFIVCYKKKKRLYYSLYNKETFKFIEEIQPTLNFYCYCHPLKENIILFSFDDCTELWKREKNAKFIKVKVYDFFIKSNIVFNSKSQLLFDYNDSIQIWETEDFCPKQLITKIKIGDIKKIFFLNNKKILVVCNTSSMIFFCSKTYKIIKYLENSERYNIYKIDETSILGIEGIYSIKGPSKKMQIMKIPEFKIIKDLNINPDIKDVLFYKDHFLLYSFQYIKIFNNKYSIFEKDSYIKGIDKLVYLKDNYLVGSIIKNNDYDYQRNRKDGDYLIIYEMKL